MATEAGWIVRGNDLLLHRVTHHYARYAPDVTVSQIATVIPGRETHRRAKILAMMKNAWVQEMIDAMRAGKPHADGGKALWEEHMAKAEKLIDEGFEPFEPDPSRRDAYAERVDLDL